jgi:hypothetical protein
MEGWGGMDGTIDAIVGLGPRAKVLLLGTFHFANPSRDTWKPPAVDMLTEERQAQIVEVVDRLATFAPTKAAVEVRGDSADRLQREYDAYRAGGFPLAASEVHQLGFWLAARAGHDRLYAIDDWGPVTAESQWEPLINYARANGREDLVDDPLDERFKRLARHDDDLRLELSLREYYRARNSADFVDVDHGLGYFEGWFRLRGESDYSGPNHITQWWYGRNLRIFSNLQRITESPADRILVICGAGHPPILRHCLQCSPEHELAEVGEYL